MDAVVHFDRSIRRYGVTAWTAGRLDRVRLFDAPQPVVSILSSPEMAAWNAHYRAKGYARHDPLVAYGRGPNRARATDDFQPASAVERRIADDRAAHGFARGLIVPLHPINTGGFVTLWGVDPAILAAGPTALVWQEVVGLCFFVGERGDYAQAVRVHAGGERLSEREAAVVRPLLAGRSLAGVAGDLRIQPRSAAQTLARVRRRLIAQGLLPGWAGRDAVAVAADRLGLLP